MKTVERSIGEEISPSASGGLARLSDGKLTPLNIRQFGTPGSVCEREKEELFLYIVSFSEANKYDNPAQRCTLVFGDLLPSKFDYPHLLMFLQNVETDLETLRRLEQDTYSVQSPAAILI
ncbi:hypothetical protein AVEN_265689-1 [Araneus ventricosus]|uniref:Uncharacterized protein n=1 Tax=Araneus ventricosus TaxID=182803 RepID=A0A4Y2K866_ARAVE|nr:hypothetical protein AVEN_265689-1 [Araneus ventricosus]